MPNLFAELWMDLQQPNILWQVATLALALLLAFGLSRLIRFWLLPATTPSSLAWRVGAGGAERLAFPLCGVLMVWLARLVLQPFHHVNLLHLALPLLFSLAVIRLCVYLIRKAFAPSGLLASFEKLIALLVWLGVALHLSNLLPEVLDWLEALRVPLGKNKVSLLLLLQGLLSVIVTLLLALWAGAAIEQRLLHMAQLDNSLRVVLARVVRALLLVLAVLLALSLSGIDLTVLSVFGGALGVGLGLGLQRIASNFVSGFVVLFEKSLRIGDLITVDKFHGQVAQIKTRFTVLRALDGTEAIIPNEMLIANPVLNHSYTDKRVRLAIRLQVAYQSELSQVMPLLEQAALAQPRVLRDPAPAAHLVNFAADGFELELGFWIADPEEGSLAIRSAIALQIWADFQRCGIQVPYPQREIHLPPVNP
ncbi:mechanosensitive ion channel family protein [Parvibium lacunae]|nr:mechanosensitive ion channel domain-containing protein [Parvibium lacunae]